MIATTGRSRAVGNQVVFTFWPDSAEWYQGVLTGHGNDDGDFVLRHVIAFKPGVLLPLLRAGIEEARVLGYRQITFGIPDTFPKARGLSLAALKVGCTVYEHRDGWTWWRRAL